MTAPHGWPAMASGHDADGRVGSDPTVRPHGRFPGSLRESWPVHRRQALAGAPLGWACFALSSIAYGGRLMHFGEPVERASAVLTAESHATTTPVARTVRSQP